MIVEGKIVGGGDLKVTGLIDGENVGAGTVDDAFAPRWYLVEWYDGRSGRGLWWRRKRRRRRCQSGRWRRLGEERL
jgi:hypothetical protein